MVLVLVCTCRRADVDCVCEDVVLTPLTMLPSSPSRVTMTNAGDSYAHRGFAQSAHELVKQVEPELTSLAERLPDYR